MIKSYVVTKKEYFDSLFAPQRLSGEISSPLKVRRFYATESGEVTVDYYKSADVYVVRADVLPYLPKGFIDVSDNKLFLDEALERGSVKNIHPILEGTDGVGKTTFLIELLKKGLVCADRSADIISKNMLFSVDMKERAKIYADAFMNHKHPVIFIINTDKEELERRINKRAQTEGLCEFDDEAYRYGLLYLDTFRYMQQQGCLPKCFHLLDATGKSVTEVADEIWRISALLP